jgi:hypothetical protein
LRRAWREVEEAHFLREVELRKREQQQKEDWHALQRDFCFKYIPITYSKGGSYNMVLRRLYNIFHVGFVATASTKIDARYWHKFLGVFLILENPFNKALFYTKYGHKIRGSVSAVHDCTVHTVCTGN